MTLDRQLDNDASASDALDQYLADLQAGKIPDRDNLVRRHPELSGVVDCVDDLERLARSVPADHEADPGSTLPCNGPTPGTFVLEHPSPGCRFGNYELLSILGRGGMGVVYKAREAGLDRVVALKMILSSQLASEAEVQRFHAEARAAARLQHPHILQIHEAGEVLGQHYFSMQYVEGSSLARLLIR